MYDIRVSQEEAHKLSDILNQVILNKEHCISAHCLIFLELWVLRVQKIVMPYSTSVLNVYV